MPTADFAGNKENATVDAGAFANLTAQEQQAVKKKKNRSKSLGPGGLDALKEGSGNKQEVGVRTQSSEKSKADLW